MENIARLADGRRPYLFLLWNSLVAFSVGWFNTIAIEQTSAVQTTDVADDKVLVLNAEGTLREQRAVGLQPVLYAPVELDSLLAGKTYRLRIKVLNPTATTLRFTELNSTCGCANVTADGNQVPAFGTMLVQMDLKVPTPANGSGGATRVQVGAAFTSVDPTDVGFRLVVTYKVRDAFCFGVERVEIEIPPDEPLVLAKVPVVIIPPLTIADMDVIATDNLRDFSATLLTDELDSSQAYVELNVPRASIGRSGVVGELILKRRDSEQVAGVMVRIHHRPNIAIRPESIRLSRDNKSQPFTASAILRVGLKDAWPPNQLGEQAEHGGELPARADLPDPEVALSINARPARVVISKLGNSGYYRVSIRYDGPLDNDAGDTLQARWKILYDGVEHSIQAQVFVPEN